MRLFLLEIVVGPVGSSEDPANVVFGNALKLDGFNVPEEREGTGRDAVFPELPVGKAVPEPEAGAEVPPGPEGKAERLLVEVPEGFTDPGRDVAPLGGAAEVEPSVANVLDTP